LVVTSGVFNSFCACWIDSQFPTRTPLNATTAISRTPLLHGPQVKMAGAWGGRTRPPPIPPWPESIRTAGTRRVPPRPCGSALPPASGRAAGAPRPRIAGLGRLRKTGRESPCDHSPRVRARLFAKVPLQNEKARRGGRYDMPQVRPGPSPRHRQ
jgi:hypothetical protein